MYEHRTDPLLPRGQFAMRVTRHGAWAGAVLLLWLAVGVGVYMFAGLGLVDAVLNASMILSGMGPVYQFTPEQPAAKILASGYALVSGVVFLAAASVVIAPVLHRVLHKFHLDEKDDPGEGRKR